MIITDDAPLPIPLSDFSNAPDPIQAGNPVTLSFTLKNDTDHAITCYQIDINLNPGDGPENLCTIDAAKGAQVTPDDDMAAGWKINVVTNLDKQPVIRLTPPLSKQLKAGNSLIFTASVNANNKLKVDDLTQTSISVTEWPGSDLSNFFSQSITLAKTDPQTEFNSFAPDPADDIIVTQGHPLTLGWRLTPPANATAGKTPGSPSYTLEINYDQLSQPLDITDLNAGGGGVYTGPNNNHDLTLAHTTPFTLTLTLYDKSGNQTTHTQTALITVQNSDVDLGNLNVNYTTNILKHPQLITTVGNHTATTDGLLLATVQGSSGSASSLVIIVTPHGGNQTRYLIANNQGHGQEPATSFTGNRILLPIPRNSSVEIDWVQAQGTYRTAWYPLGRGTLKDT